MNVRLFSGLMLAVLLTPALAADRAGRQSLSPESIRAEITYLASDPLRGRLSGEPGNEMAARYIAQEFARDGLKPLGTIRQRDPNAPLDGSGYFQPFTFVAGRAVGKGELLEFRNDAARRDGNRNGAPPSGTWQKLRLHDDYEVSGISGGGRVEGGLVFVGYGIRAPQSNHDDYANLNLKGKIALLLAGNPKDDPHSPLADFADLRRKTLAARELGAAAVIVTLPKSATAFPHPRFEFADASDAGLPVLRVRWSAAAELLKAAGQPDLDRLAADADEDKFVSAPAPCDIRLAADVHEVTKVSANIVGMIEGSDPTLKAETVVIGAHMDHWGMGGPGSLAKSDAPAIHHGADDNASGTAGVMELARYFGMPSVRDAAPASGHDPVPAPPRLTRSLVFICFSGEELGLLGSDHYVKHPVVPLAQTVAMLNMDMVGRLRDNKLTVIGSGTAAEWDRLLDETNRSAGFTLAKSESGFGASDQQSFYTQNVPVLFFFTGTHSDYHTPTDTADKINAEGEARVLQLVAACAEQIADAPARPAFQRIKTPEQNAPSRGFRVYFGSVPDYAATVEGVQLNGVREGSPAEKGGLKAGDIIIKFGDRTIKNVYDYTYALQDHKPGDVVDVVVKRGGQTLTLKVTLTARPE
jgi:aminopeptidase YwaD